MNKLRFKCLFNAKKLKNTEEKHFIKLLIIENSVRFYKKIYLLLVNFSFYWFLVANVQAVKSQFPNLAMNGG